MPSTDRLEEFARIVQEGSISQAARVLEMPRATLSRRLSQLEEELGVRLVHRRTRSLVLTDAGHELFRRARRISAEAAEAWDAVRRLDDTPRGTLRVSVSAGIDPDLFVDFLADSPEVSIVVRSSSRHVDLLGEGIDVAIRYGDVTDPDLYVRRVAMIRTLVVASPAYLERHGHPRRPEDLARHLCLRRALGERETMDTWALRTGGSVEVTGRLVTNDLPLLRAAALRGEGLALLPRAIVQEDLGQGALVPVLEKQVGDDFPVCLVHADREYIAPKVRAFVDRAAEHLAGWFASVDANGLRLDRR